MLDILANRRQQEVARLEDTLRRLRRQQEEALEETKRLDTVEQSQDGLTRALALAVRDLARSQHKLAADTAQLSRRLAGAIAMALARAGVDMGQAGDLLDTRQTGPATQAMERSAMRRLDLLLEALKPEDPTAQGEPLQGEGPAVGRPGSKAPQVRPGQVLPN